jgi:DNA-binding response OmpR family regulator
MHVLIVEDDADIGARVAHYARREGWTAQLVASGADALRAVQEAQVDLIVLDVMLPGISGFDVCLVRLSRNDTREYHPPAILRSTAASWHRGSIVMVVDR